MHIVHRQLDSSVSMLILHHIASRHTVLFYFSSANVVTLGHIQSHNSVIVGVLHISISNFYYPYSCNKLRLVYSMSFLSAVNSDDNIMHGNSTESSPAAEHQPTCGESLFIACLRCLFRDV